MVHDILMTQTNVATAHSANLITTSTNASSALSKSGIDSILTPASVSYWKYREPEHVSSHCLCHVPTVPISSHTWAQSRMNILVSCDPETVLYQSLYDFPALEVYTTFRFTMLAKLNTPETS